MENKNRNVWIIVAIVVVLLCCLLAALAVAAAAWLGWFGMRVSEGGITSPGFQFDEVIESREMSFDVGASPTLVIDNFAGNVRIETGSDGVISAVASIRAAGAASVRDISVEPTQEGDTVSIRTRRPSGRIATVAVDLDLTVPEGTRIEVTSGAGDVTAEDVHGEIMVDTGAGNVTVTGNEGQVRLETGAGDIDYTGAPQGTSTFSTGAGNIQISLPADFSGAVDLDTGIGSVDVRGFDVEGSVSRTNARGTIGTGEGPAIEADTGAGDIDLVRQ